jgi:hypothetical protein
MTNCARWPRKPELLHEMIAFAAERLMEIQVPSANRGRSWRE